jgi:hypothetical protein
MRINWAFLFGVPVCLVLSVASYVGLVVIARWIFS